MLSTVGFEIASWIDGANDLPTSMILFTFS
jgi:hypothetical protein